MGTNKKKKKIRSLKNAKSKILLTLFAILLVLPLLFQLFPISGFENSLFGFEAVDTLFENPHNNGDYVEFFDVGQADCTLIKSGDYAVLIDFGLQSDDDKLYNNLLKRGIKSIDLAVITHHHSDHMGGFSSLSEKMKIERLVISSNSAEDGEKELYKEVTKSANKNGTQLLSPNTGDIFTFGNAKLKVLSCNNSATEENNRSIIIKVNICGRSILFTGDADSYIEQSVSQKYNIKCDILKMGHHGSATSSDERFLKSAKPDFAVASCGYDNLYNHPSDAAVQRAEKLGIKVLRTDLDRNIRVSFNSDSSYTIITERGVVYDNIR